MSNTIRNIFRSSRKRRKRRVSSSKPSRAPLTRRTGGTNLQPAQDSATRRRQKASRNVNHRNAK